MSLYKTALDKIPFKSLTNNCVILDLDESLIHSNEKIDQLKELRLLTDPKLIDLKKRTYQITLDDVSYKKGTGIKTMMWGITRPHVKEFLISCFSYFKVVAVWSAGKRKYVDAVVDYLFRDIKRPHVVYAREQCEATTNGLLIKPLSKMIKNEPGLSKYMSLDNTFIIDDRKSTFESVNPDNGILIPAYNPSFNIKSLRTDDIALKQLMIWLLRPEVMSSDNVRNLDKSTIFQTDVTTDLSYDIKNIKNNNRIDDRKVSRLEPIVSKA